MQIEPGRTISFRPTEWDAFALEAVSESNPELPDATSLLRHLLRFWTDAQKQKKSLEELKVELKKELEEELKQELEKTKAEIEERLALIESALRK